MTLSHISANANIAPTQRIQTAIAQNGLLPVFGISISGSSYSNGVFFGYGYFL